MTTVLIIVALLLVGSAIWSWRGIPGIKMIGTGQLKPTSQGPLLAALSNRQEHPTNSLIAVGDRCEEALSRVDHRGKELSLHEYPTISLAAVGNRREEALRRVDQRGDKLRLYGFSIVAVFFGGLFAWSALAPLASAVVARGQVVVESNRKDVQAEKGGVIEQILHHDGDVVAEGDVLIKFDDTRTRASYQIYFGKIKGFQEEINGLRVVIASQAQQLRLIGEEDPGCSAAAERSEIRSRADSGEGTSAIHRFAQRTSSM